MDPLAAKSVACPSERAVERSVRRAPIPVGRFIVAGGGDDGSGGDPLAVEPVACSSGGAVGLSSPGRASMAGGYATAGGGDDGGGGSKGGGGAGAWLPPAGGSVSGGGGGVSPCTGTSRMTISDAESSATKSPEGGIMAGRARDGRCYLSSPMMPRLSRLVSLSSSVLLLSFRDSFSISRLKGGEEEHCWTEGEDTRRGETTREDQSWETRDNQVGKDGGAKEGT